MSLLPGFPRVARAPLFRSRTDRECAIDCTRLTAENSPPTEIDSDGNISLAARTHKKTHNMLEPDQGDSVLSRARGTIYRNTERISSNALLNLLEVGPDPVTPVTPQRMGKRSVTPSSVPSV